MFLVTALAGRVSECEASSVYKVNSQTARATQKQQKNKKIYIKYKWVSFKGMSSIIWRGTLSSLFGSIGIVSMSPLLSCLRLRLDNKIPHLIAHEWSSSI